LRGSVLFFFSHSTLPFLFRFVLLLFLEIGSFLSDFLFPPLPVGGVTHASDRLLFCLSSFSPVQRILIFFSFHPFSRDTFCGCDSRYESSFFLGPSGTFFVGTCSFLFFLAGACGLFLLWHGEFFSFPPALVRASFFFFSFLFFRSFQVLRKICFDPFAFGLFFLDLFSQISCFLSRKIERLPPHFFGPLVDRTNSAPVVFLAEDLFSVGSLFWFLTASS